MSAFADSDGIAPLPLREGLRARAVHGDRMTLALVELDPGTVVPEHAHDNEQLGILIEGSLTFTAEGETRELGPGGTWRILSNVPHVAVAGPEGCVIVEVFAGPREDWRAIEPLAVEPGRWPGTR